MGKYLRTKRTRCIGKDKDIRLVLPKILKLAIQTANVRELQLTNFRANSDLHCGIVGPYRFGLRGLIISDTENVATRSRGENRNS